MRQGAWRRFYEFLGSGKDYGVKLQYSLQHGAGGIAEALSLTEDFADNGQITVILGDNIFEDDFSKDIEEFKNREGARVFIKEVDDPQRFGVAEIQGDKIINIEEKPENPKSNYITTGFYLYNSDVFGKIRKLKPSQRGELELSDVHNMYIHDGKLSYGAVKGFWSDAGTFKTLLECANWLAKKTS